MKNFIQKLLAILIAGIYAVSPVDCVADIVPVAGQSDDIIVIIVAILYIIYISRKNKE